MLSYFATTVQSINPYGSLYKLYSYYFPPSHPWHQYHPHLPDGRIVLIRRRDNGRWALPGGIVDWGRYFHNGTKGASRETGLELVKIRRLVEFTRHQTEIREFIDLYSSGSRSAGEDESSGYAGSN